MHVLFIEVNGVYTLAVVWISRGKTISCCLPRPKPPGTAYGCSEISTIRDLGAEK